MYLESSDRLGRVTLRAQANVAEGLARTTERATAKLSGSVAATLCEQDNEPTPPGEGERRRSGRFATGSTIHARRIPGVNFEVPLDNVSAGGCRIELLEECAVGEDVIARFPDLEPLGARVRWTVGFTAGLQFVRPIHPAVFGSLLERLMAPQQPNV
jgi:PilZ domain